jgi:hypothetical protein
VSATFEQWVQAAFDHPSEEPEWYWDTTFDSVWQSLGLSNMLTVRYLTRLFLETHRLKQYSLAQVAKGIWFLIGDASPAQPTYALLRPEVAFGERAACIQAMTIFFHDFVAPAAPGLYEIESDPFHIACYMWWDIFPTWGGPQAGEPGLQTTCLKVMADVLDLPSELCRLSALHGLNHWHLHYAEQVARVVDAFLDKQGNVTPRIREYASRARHGLCQ